jgi:hypothetical protein
MIITLEGNEIMWIALKIIGIFLMVCLYFFLRFYENAPLMDDEGRIIDKDE